MRSGVASASVSSGTRLLAVAVWLEIVSSVFEGPLRYVLNAVHADPLIFVRDALLVAAVLLVVVERVPSRTVPAAIGVFALLALVHGAVSVANLGTAVGAGYGLKMLMPALCGFLVAETIFDPGPRLMRLVALLWLAAAVGAAVDKFGFDYPWVGLNVDVGGVSVYLGRDWQSGAVERVGGLARSSMNLAVQTALLSFMLLTSIRSRVLRLLIGAVTLTVLVWTTQKGAILSYVLAVLALMLSGPNRLAPLKAALVLATALLVFAPTVLIHFDMPRDSGVFSFESMIERIQVEWPNAWDWIGHFPPFMGIGLGGIGGSQRFFAPHDYHACDNLFVYLFANFGVASLAYLGLAVTQALTMQSRQYRRDSIALASVVLLLMHGLVASLVEDQIASLWLGAALGWVARRQPAASGNAWWRTRALAHGLERS